MEPQDHFPEAPKTVNNIQRPAASPLNHDAMALGSNADSPVHLNNERSTQVDPSRKIRRASAGSEHSVEQSPLHPRNQAKGSHVAAPNTPGRLKTRTGGRGDESPDKGPTVPKFGEWDENNPSSADGYTQLFNQVREEKQTGSAKVPIITNDAMYLDSYNKSSASCCFNWCRK